MRVNVSQAAAPDPGAGYHRFTEIHQVEENLAEIPPSQLYCIQQPCEISHWAAQQSFQMRTHNRRHPRFENCQRLLVFFELVRTQLLRRPVRPAHRHHLYVAAQCSEFPDFP